MNDVLQIASVSPRSTLEIQFTKGTVWFESLFLEVFDQNWGSIKTQFL